VFRGNLSSLVFVVLSVFFIGVSGSQATTVPLGADSLTDLLGPDPQALGGVTTTRMENGGLGADVLNQAYVDEDGITYAYLYQVDNDLQHFIEVFTLAPFAGASGNTEMGWLTGDIPTGFLPGGNTPWTTGNVNTSVGPTVTFYYLDAFGDAIFTGQHSVVMYVVSDLPPDEIVGNIINGLVASGDVVGPVPEPATIALLGLGSFVLMRKRRN